MKVKASKKVRAATKSANFTANLVKIGSSRVVRIPKSLIKKAGLSKRVRMEMRGNEIVISRVPAKEPRAGWEEQMEREIRKHGPPAPMDPDWEYLPNKFDEKEWTW